MTDRDDAEVDLARRKLLRKAVYEAPAILGVVAMSWASAAQTTSCSPNGCNPVNPCAPSVGCNPNCTPNATCGPTNCRPAG